MKNNLLKFYIVAFYICSTTILLAQVPGDTGNGSGGLEGTDPAAAPIDDYTPVLIVFGLLLAGYVFLNKKKQQCS